MRDRFLNGDERLYLWFHRFSDNKKIEKAMRFFTLFGETRVGVAFFLVMSMVAYITGSEAAMKGAIGIFVSQAIVHTIKRIVHRRRPYTTLDLDSVQNPPRCVYSFPSGHTACAFSVARGLSRLVPELSIVLYCVAIMTGLSRVSLGYHYPTDVVFGVILAVFW